MIAVDTNVLVRYLVNDDRKQAAAARKLIENAAEQGEQVFIGTIILVETVWVLASLYKFKKNEVVSVIEDIISFNAFRLENPDIIIMALDHFKHGKADFSDYVSSVTSLTLAEAKLSTFDKKCAEEELFVRLIK